MPVTQQELDALAANVQALNDQIADGVRQVAIRGQTTIMNTTDSLIKARDDAATQLRRKQAEFDSQGPVSARYLYHAGRGY